MKAALSTKQKVDVELAVEEAKLFNTRALNGRMIKLVGEFGYDSNNRTYQWQRGSIKPLRFPGWVLVSTTMPKPLAHSTKGAMKKVR
jgi:hypothetical protein